MHDSENCDRLNRGAGIKHDVLYVTNFRIMHKMLVLKTKRTIEKTVKIIKQNHKLHTLLLWLFNHYFVFNCGQFWLVFQVLLLLYPLSGCQPRDACVLIFCYHELHEKLKFVEAFSEYRVLISEELKIILSHR